MRVNRLRVLASTLIVLLAAVVVMQLQRGFTPFEYARAPINATLVPFDSDVGRRVSATLWSDRALDLIVLAFLLFTTATGCATLLRPERGDPG